MCEAAETPLHAFITSRAYHWSATACAKMQVQKTFSLNGTRRPSYHVQDLDNHLQHDP